MTTARKGVKFKATITKSTGESGWHYLPVEAKIVEKFAFKGKFKRVVCTINGSLSFQCALMPWGEIFYIIVNKEKRDSIGIEGGELVNVELVRDESKYGLPMPEELQEVLNQDPDGDRLFHALSPGKQRSLIYMISNVKNIDKRIHVALIILEHLKENGGKIIGEQLQHDVKRPIF